MKIVKLKASQVHDYIDFDITFNPEVSFIAGLNGSGKTTALKLVMAMLTPSIKELSDIKFKTCELIVKKDEETDIHIHCKQDNEKISLWIDGIKERLVTDKGDIDYSEKRKMSFLKRKNPVVKEISRLSSPMFLSLDRRFVKGTRDEDDFHVIFDGEFERRFSKKKNLKDESLDEVLEIISQASSGARAKQLNSDKKLRNEIILDSFSFSESISELKLPDQQTLRDLRRKQRAIKKILDTLDVPSEEFEERYAIFFDKIEEIAEVISKTDFESNEINTGNNEEFQKAMSEWYVNQNQLDRINRLFVMVEKYQKVKTRIYNKLNDFERLVNQFLEQTNKKIRVDQVGNLKIRINEKERDLSILSSGERQILIMLAHLVLNKTLTRDGVFIIDEPELSLHLSWQDMFVGAIQSANPNLQIILATHSPAIIGKRKNMYVPLNGGI
ncbi:AAA family ATPase [Corallincola platygyrae]|uniref:AAA family ATPase n=1 Tax=Corallincola platygyrae TaxID=1193278 RepID=A0ABW4XKW7_9GAMM